MKLIADNNRYVFEIVLIAFAILCLMQKLYTQEADLRRPVFPSGIHAAYNYGSYAVRDQYISNEKYTGTMSAFSVGWARCHSKYLYKLKFEYGSSGDIKNNNVETTVTQFTLGQGFLYPINNHAMDPDRLFIYLGPNTEIFYFGNDPKIAVSGFDYTNSYAIMFSLGADIEAIYPFSRKFHLESSLGMTVLSLGWRSVDSEEDDQPDVKLLTLVTGLNTVFDLGVRYKFYRRFSARAGYKFQLVNITPWEPMTSVSNSFFIGLTYNF